jgi:hypothetical protein
MVFDSSPEQSSGTGDAGGAEDDANEDQSKENRDGELGINGDTDAAKGLPIITTPFSDFSSDEEIETLEALSDEKEEQINDDDSVIKEREGVHYISEDVLTPSPEVSATLNPGFKELVDDVTK